MIKGLAAAATVFVALSAAGQTQHGASKQDGKTEQQVLAVNREWAKAVEQGNLTALGRILDDDLISISGSGEVETKAKEIQEDELGPNQSYDYFSTDDTRVRVYGTSVVVTGRCQWRLRENGKVVEEDQRRYISVFVNRNGQWRIVAQQMTRFLKTKQ